MEHGSREDCIWEGGKALLKLNLFKGAGGVMNGVRGSEVEDDN